MNRRSGRPTASPSHTDAETVTRLRLALLRTARRLRQEVQAGVTSSQLSALAVIEREGPVTLGELANLEQVQPPTTTRVVTALEGAGLVERVPHESDRRVTRVQVTAAGNRELDRIRSARDAWLAQRLARLSPADIHRLTDALPVLERLLETEP
jgi:DNA-binding MarR family transcriptional regulator